MKYVAISGFCDPNLDYFDWIFDCYSSLGWDFPVVQQLMDYLGCWDSKHFKSSLVSLARMEVAVTPNLDRLGFIVREHYSSMGYELDSHLILSCFIHLFLPVQTIAGCFD